MGKLKLHIVTIPLIAMIICGAGILTGGETFGEAPSPSPSILIDYVEPLVEECSSVPSDVACSPTEEPIKPIYGFTYADIVLLAQLLCGDRNVDGDGEFDFDFGKDDRYDQISLVLCVVMNRVKSDKYPNTVHDVVWQHYGNKYQFSVMRKWANPKKICAISEIAIQRVTEWCEAYDRGDPGAQTIPESHLYFNGNGRINKSR